MQAAGLAQAKRGARPAPVVGGSAGPRSTVPEGLPPQLRQQMEARSGISLLDVRVHPNSPLPGRIGAAAYASGDEIHLGPGQDRHLAHEAWHVVQQRQGRVPATVSFSGVRVNRSGPLEHEADRVGRLTGRGLTATDFKRPLAPSAAVRPEAAGGACGVPEPPVLQGQFFSQTTWDRINPARWRINPYQLWHHYQESQYEQAHDNYHTMQAHGWVHTLENVHARTQRAKGPGNLSEMRDLPSKPFEQLRDYGLGNIRTQPKTSRFATASWQGYAREQAIKHALTQLPPGTKFPAGAYKYVKGQTTEYHRFGIDFSGAEVGLGMDAKTAAANARPVTKVQAGVQYDPIEKEAWLIQLFPHNNPTNKGAVQTRPMQYVKGAVPTTAIPSATIKRQDIPWF